MSGDERFDRQLSEGKRLFGTKRAQVGLRLSQVELDATQMLQAHFGTDFATLVEYAMIRTAQELQKPETNLDELRANFLKFTQVIPKTVVFKHARISPVIKDDMEQGLRLLRGDIKLATGVRWALVYVTPHILAQPSHEASMQMHREAARKRDEVLAAQVAKNKEQAQQRVLVPSGYGFIDPKTW